MRALAALTILILLAGSAFAADGPGKYLTDARGRIFVFDAPLAQVRGWRDAQCESSFELVREGAATVRWTIDWRRVRTVQITTRKHFITDVAEAVYQEQPGIALYGRNTTTARLPDGTPVEQDNIEFFLKDVSKMDYAFNALKAHAQSCRR